MTRTTRILILAAAATPLLAGCTGSGLQEEDPKGYAACEQFSLSRGTDEAAESIGAMLEAGELAAQAKTPAIRDAAKPMFDEEAMAALEGTESEGQQFWLTDSDLMLSACTDAGFNVADVVQKD